jgi:hypothetical protein
LRHFCIFRAALKSYLTSLTPSTTTPRLGTPPANSRRTKQNIYIYYIYIYIIYYILYIVYYNIYIHIYRSFKLRPRHDMEPPSLLLVAEKSYTTSSCTVMSIYVAARFRVEH